jgi:hypothetical protein
MKKIITLLIAAGAFVAVHAQTSRDEARRVILGGGNGDNSSTRGRDVILGGGNDNTRTYPNSYPGNTGSRQAQIDQVNREYDAKIYSIRNNGTLTQSEKERMIRQLEMDRARRIREINQYSNRSYGSKGKNHGDEYEERHDNGKHKGWTKGKGNQNKNKHGYRDDD